MKTIICGTFGNVAEFEATTRSRDVLKQKIAEKLAKPSRNHTRASTMSQQQIKNIIRGKDADLSASQKNPFKLKRFSNVNARVGAYHVNQPGGPTSKVKYSATLEVGKPLASA